MFLKNILDYIVWVIFIITFFVLTIRDYQSITVYKIQAYDYPLIILVLMAVCVIVEFVIDTLKNNEKLYTSYKTLNNVEFDVVKKIHEIFVFILPLLYVASMNYLGFIVSTAIFMMIYMRFLYYKNIKVIFCCTFGFIFMYILIFVKFLYTPTPFGVGIFYKFNANIMEVLHKL